MENLRNRVNRQRRGQSGFTLIEMLVVIAILSVLAGVAVMAVGSSRDNAEAAGCKAELRELRLAAERYRADFGGSYAIDEATLVSAGVLEKPSVLYAYTSTAQGPPSYVPQSTTPDCTSS